MLLTKLTFGRRKAIEVDASHHWCNTLAPEQMHAAVQNERKRADRGNGSFALVTFSAQVQTENREALIRLTDILKQRIRGTDVLGWFDSQTLVVLLVDCPERSSQQFVKDVCDSIPRQSDLPISKIYRYPSDFSSDEEGHDRRERKREDIAPPVHAAESLFTKPLPLWKRCLDIVGSLIGLVLFLPLFIVVAAAIKIFTPGPVLFAHVRSGRSGRPFLMYKFRSMVVDAEAKKQALLSKNEQDGPAFKITGDPRVTRLGNFLRKSSIDELPQLWNVLKGEMTLVGPRPLLCAEQSSAEAWQQQRLDVMPGLTCIWQIRGRSKVTFAEWVRMDIEYIHKFSLLNDLIILAKTVPAVLFRRGAK